MISSPDDSATSSSVSLRSVALVGGASFGQMILLLALQRVQARAYGASTEMDAYLCAYALPLTIGGILGAAAGTAVVPFAHQTTATAGSAAASRAVRRIGVGLTLVSLLLALPLFLAPSPIITWLYPDLPREGHLTAVSLLRPLCWMIPLTSMTAYLYGVFHARSRFLRPAMAGLIGPIVTLLLLAAVSRPSIGLLASSILVGGIVGIILLLPGAWSGDGATDESARPSIRGFLTLAFPVLLSNAYVQLNPLVDRLLAQSLSTGSISHLAYSGRVINAVATLATSGLSVVIFPALARHAAVQDYRQMRGDLSEAWRLITVIMVPVVAGILLCGRSIIAAFLQVGLFTAADTAAVNALVSASLAYLVAAAVSEVAVRGLTALNRAWFVSVVSMIVFTSTSLAKWLIVGRYQAVGLAAAMSGAGIVSSVIYVGMVSRLTGARPTAELVGTLVRSLLATTFSVGLARWWMTDDGVGTVAAGVGLAIVVHPLLLLAFRDEFALRAWAARPWR